MKKVFIDGRDGTTGLKIYNRFEKRQDVDLLLIDPEKRKDPSERAKMIQTSDITFLCLPDTASIEAVDLAKNEKTILIDASTAHRTLPEWAYGFPELSQALRKKIQKSTRIAVPGCYASGFNSIAAPLIAANILPRDYPVVCYALSGYTGAGKKAVALYENPNRDKELEAPRLYALAQQHKHIKEMTAISGLLQAPVFSPIICNYPRGMVVCIPLFTNLLTQKYTIDDIYQALKQHYDGSPVVKVRQPGFSSEMIGCNHFEGRDDMEIEVTGNSERIVVTSRFDNLGKGASGAAIQCMNLALGLDETTGLNIGE